MMKKNTERNYQIRLAAEKKAHDEFEGWSEKRLMNEIIKLRKLISSLEEKLNSHSEKEEVKKNSFKPSFSQKWTYPQKIQYILHDKQEAMSSSQIYDILNKLDSHFEDFRNPVLILNAYLVRMVKSGRLYAHKLPGVRKSFYALPEWLGPDSKLKPGYTSHLNFLS